MIVSLHLDADHLRAWHLRLAERLSRDTATSVRIEVERHGHAPRRAQRLLDFEARVRRRSLGALAAPMEAASLAPWKGGTDHADLTVVLHGRPADPSAWQLFADGAPGEAALWDSVAQGRCPVVELRQGERVIASGRFGTEATGQLIESLDDALARAITLVAAAVAGHGPLLPVEALTAQPMTPARAARAAAGIASRRVARRVERMLYRTPQWRVGWRALAGPDLFDLRRHPPSGWHDLPDDGHRFYADPFPLLHDGAVTLFVEEYPHATGRGIISAVRFGPEGPQGRPEPVLERPYHLSYPFVFVRDGEVWMIPETSAAGTVELYRATAYPGGWVLDATLLEGVEAGDVTLVQYGDRWWMFATVRDGGAASDALYLWSAPDFRGPWRPHRRNPVLIDIASARPAGRMRLQGGRLVRPVQDCRDGYGAALGFALVERLGDDGYAQRVETILRAGAEWPGRWMHTVNQAGDFEFIDGSGVARRF